MHTLALHPDSYAVARLSADAPMPAWLDGPGVTSTTRTAAELSVLCLEERVPDGITAERGFALLAVVGPLPFDAVGVLSALSLPLAAAGIPIIAVGTYDTDLLLVPRANLAAARATLERAGHRVVDAKPPFAASPAPPSHLSPTWEAGRDLVQRRIVGPVDMLNLLRFRDLADYGASPQLAPDAPISGREAYQRYAEAVTPLLREAGARVLYDGLGGPFLIGPEGRRWDRMLLVRHASVEAFLAFARDPRYLAVAGHRAAALADSRLLPLEPSSG